MRDKIRKKVWNFSNILYVHSSLKLRNYISLCFVKPVYQCIKLWTDKFICLQTKSSQYPIEERAGHSNLPRSHSIIMYNMILLLVQWNKFQFMLSLSREHWHWLWLTEWEPVLQSAINKLYLVEKLAHLRACQDWVVTWFPFKLKTLRVKTSFHLTHNFYSKYVNFEFRL